LQPFFAHTFDLFAQSERLAVMAVVMVAIIIVKIKSKKGKLGVDQSDIWGLKWTRNIHSLTRDYSEKNSLFRETAKEAQSMQVFGEISGFSFRLASISTGLSGISCLRHKMLSRRIYASQTEGPAGESANDSCRTA
jgi:hypothetical protein